MLAIPEPGQWQTFCIRLGAEKIEILRQRPEV
jgi:hypothetical protein